MDYPEMNKLSNDAWNTVTRRSRLMESDLGQPGRVGSYLPDAHESPRRRSCWYVTLGALAGILSHTSCAVTTGAAATCTVARAIDGFLRVRAVPCTANCPANSGANDKEDHGDNPNDAPSPAVPRHLLGDGFEVMVQRPFLAGVVDGSRTMIERGADLVGHHAVWRSGCAEIAALLEQADVVPFLFFCACGIRH